MSPRCAVFLSSALLLAPVAAQAPWFKAPVMLDGMPGDLRLLGDIDGDGDIDAISFTGTTVITPMYGDGLGHFTAGATVTLPADTGPLAAMADLDGDGLADLVTTRLNSSPLGPALLIHPGTGSGVFAVPIVRPLPGNVGQLLPGRADGDGVADLFVMHFDDTLLANESRWLHGDPTRAFALGPSSTSIPYAVDVAVVELDGDGIDDFVSVVDSPLGPDAVTLWATQPTGFASLGSLPIAAGVFSARLVAIDFDADGDRDLFAISFIDTLSQAITRLRHDGGANWVVGGSQALASAAGLRYYAADWDGDGREELLVHEATGGSSQTQYHNFSVWVGNSVGLVTRAFSYLIPEFFGQQTFGGAGPVDLDGDGSLDFVDGKALVFGDGTVANPLGPQRLVSLDWDRDGDIDSQPSGMVGINDGTGAVVGHTLVVPPAPPGQFYSAPLQITDLDGDGWHELIGARFAQQLFQPPQFLDMRLFRETPGFQFVDAGPIAGPGAIMVGRILADDVDGDADLDLVTRQGAWLNNGQNFFMFGSPSFGVYEPRDLVDIDGDGVRDIVAAKFNGGRSLAVFRRTGPAAWTQSVVYPAISNAIVTPEYAIADLDDDGDPDIIATEELPNSETRASLFENQGGVLSLRTTLTVVGSYAPGDVDGDGLTDLSVSGNRRLQVFQRTAPWTYSAPVVFTMDLITSLVDVDQDGDLDACGQTTIANRTFDLPASGQRRQYGAGGIGAGGHQPVLSLVGPVRPGLAPQLRLRNAPGGTFALMLIGVGPNDAPSLFLPGVTSYVAGIADIWLFVLAGAPGVPGAGALDLAVPISASLAGLDAFLQAVVADPSLPAGIGYTNGLEVRIGL